MHLLSGALQGQSLVVATIDLNGQGQATTPTKLKTTQKIFDRFTLKSNCK